MSMNIFRICGDMSQLGALLLLLRQLYKSKNARGISAKSQELFLLVFLTRYTDLFSTFYSVYNSFMKIAYISLTAATVVTIKFTEPFQSLYNPEQDSFPHWKFAVLPCTVLALMSHLMGSGTQNFDLMELFWTFSIYLQSIAIVPQLVVLQRYRLVENLTGKFVLLMGLHRLFYIFNWIYRAHTERWYQHHYVVYVCGVVQTLLYGDFFYQYCKIKCCKRVRSTDGDDEEMEQDDDDETGLLFESEMASPKGEASSAAEHLLVWDSDTEASGSENQLSERRRQPQSDESLP